MNILIYSGETPNHSLDGICDGFVRLFGREHVRPVFHYTQGKSNQKFMQYYYLYDLSDNGKWSWSVKEADLVILSARNCRGFDEECYKHPEGLKKELAIKCPIVVIDEPDSSVVDCGNSNASLVFKRECIKENANKNIKGKTVIPLPLAAIPEPIDNFPDWESRDIDVFFRAHKVGSIRKEMVDLVKEFNGEQGLVADWPKSKYNEYLLRTKIGISCSGGGSDTYRYWEIPYFGAMLLAQKTKHVIPEDFTDEEAVFFEDISDARKIITELLDSPDRIRTIAERGRKASLERHLSINRARYILEHVKNISNG